MKANAPSVIIILIAEEKLRISLLNVPSTLSFCINISIVGNFNLNAIIKCISLDSVKVYCIEYISSSICLTLINRLVIFFGVNNRS